MTVLPHQSAMYFMGEHFTLDRLTDMTKKKGSDELTERCKRRANWITHLENNVHGVSHLSKLKKKRLIQWAAVARLDDFHGMEFFHDKICHWIGK